MPKQEMEMVRCPATLVNERKHDPDCQCCFGIGWVEAPQGKKVAPVAAQSHTHQTFSQVHIHPSAQNQPQVLYIGSPHEPRSKVADAASWILLAYVCGFAMISLIAGIMMFL